MNSGKQLFITIPLTLIMGSELSKYQFFGKFGPYRSKKFYTFQHRNRTGENLNYEDLSDHDKKNSCNCDVINNYYIPSFDERQ